MLPKWILASFTILVAGCASTPDIVAGHYLPKGSVSLKAVRTVGCSGEGEKQRLHVATAVTATPTYSRDADQWDQIELASLSSRTANSNLTLSYTEDGRLKGVNSTSAGVGQEILQSGVKLAGILLNVAGLKSAEGDPAAACRLISEYAPKEKIVTLTYGLSENFLDDGKNPRVPAAPLPFSANTIPTKMEQIDGALPVLCAIMSQGEAPLPVSQLRDTAANEKPQDNSARLTLRQPAPVMINVVQFEGAGPRDCASASGKSSEWRSIWDGAVQVPQLGKFYELPIPIAALFGENSFQLALSESGAITSIGYGLKSGIPAALGGAIALADPLQPSTAAERAAETKSEADLIFQQQRLIKCQQDPLKCS